MELCVTELRGRGGPRVPMMLFARKRPVGNHCGKTGENQLPKPQDFVKANRDNHQLELNDMPAACVCYVMRQLKADDNQEDWK